MAKRASKAPAPSYDCVISGAGLAGLVCACVLRKAGFSVAIIAADSGANPLNKSDNRAIAIMNGQWPMLHDIGVADAVLPHTTPLQHLTLIDATQRLVRAPTVTFHASEMDAEQFARNVPIADLMQVLQSKVVELKIPRIIGQIAHVARQTYSMMVTIEGLAMPVGSNLIVAADGKHSTARILADIGNTSQTLAQTALSFTVQHALPHGNASLEFHMPDGPLTFVPIFDAHQSNVIWTLKHAEAARMRALPVAEFEAEFMTACHHVLGVCTLLSPINPWPLSVVRSQSYGQNRTALVGDAAHAFPPIGAQGFNLGLRDIRALRDVLVAARNLGLDIGGHNVLHQYHIARQSDVQLVTHAIDMLNMSLLSKMLPAQIARTAGLLVMQNNASLRKNIMDWGMMGV